MNAEMSLHAARQHNSDLQDRAQARRLRLPAATAREVAASEVILRLATTGDAAALHRLAELEGRYAIDAATGPVLVAEVRGEVLAAKPLGGGDTLADPFRSTAWLAELLETGAARFRAAEGPRDGGRIRAAARRLLGHGRRAEAGRAVPCG